MTQGFAPSEAARRVPSETFTRWVGRGVILYWIVTPITIVYAYNLVTPSLGKYLPAGNSGFAAAVGRRIFLLLIAVVAVLGLELIKRASRIMAPTLGLDLAIDENDRRFERWRKTPASSYTWTGIFKVTCLVMLVAASIAGALLVWQVSAPLIQEKVYPVDLSQPPSAVREGTGFVETKHNVRAENWMTSRHADGSAQAYAVLAEEGWPAGQPVRYFGHFALVPEYAGAAAELPHFPNQFTGKAAGGRLPAQLQKTYESRGLSIDPAYVVLEWVAPERLPKPADIKYEYSIAALGFGAVFAFFQCFAASLAKALSGLGRSAR